MEQDLWGQHKRAYRVTVHRQRHLPGPDRDNAERQFHALLAARPEEHKGDPQSVIAVMDPLLDEATFKPDATRDCYQKHC